MEHAPDTRPRCWFDDFRNVRALADWMHDVGRITTVQELRHVEDHPHRYHLDWLDYRHETDHPSRDQAA